MHTQIASYPPTKLHFVSYMALAISSFFAELGIRRGKGQSGLGKHFEFFLL